MAEQILSIGGFAGIKVDIDEVAIQPGVNPSLPSIAIPFKFTAPSYKESGIEVPYSFLQIRTTLCLEKDNAKICAGHALQSYSYKIQGDQSGFTIVFDFFFDAMAVRTIEANRINDAKFKINMAFQIGFFKNDAIWNIRDGLNEFQLIIPRSHWVERILPNLGKGKYLLLEVPEGTKVLTETIDYLEKANKAFNAWDIESTFLHCRNIGSSLDGTLKDQLGADSFSYNERWGRTYRGFQHHASLGVHEADHRKSKYTPNETKVHRIDAEQILFRTKMLLKLAEELLDEL